MPRGRRRPTGDRPQSMPARRRLVTAHRSRTGEGGPWPREVTCPRRPEDGEFRVCIAHRAPARVGGRRPLLVGSPDPATGPGCPQFRNGAGLGLAYPPAVRDLRVVVVGLVVGTTLLSRLLGEGRGQRHPAVDERRRDHRGAARPSGPADFPVPDEARTKDAAGAEAFLRYWIDLLNRQQAIPAGQPLRDLGPECQECLRIAQQLRRRRRSRTAVRRRRTRLHDWRLPRSIDGDTAIVSFGARAGSRVRSWTPRGTT